MELILLWSGIEDGAASLVSVMYQCDWARHYGDFAMRKISM